MHLSGRESIRSAYLWPKALNSPLHHPRPTLAPPQERRQLFRDRLCKLYRDFWRRNGHRCCLFRPQKACQSVVIVSCSVRMRMKRERSFHPLAHRRLSIAETQRETSKRTPVIFRTGPRHPIKADAPDLELCQLSRSIKVCSPWRAYMEYTGWCVFQSHNSWRSTPELRGACCSQSERPKNQCDTSRTPKPPRVWLTVHFVAETGNRCRHIRPQKHLPKIAQLRLDLPEPHEQRLTLSYIKGKQEDLSYWTFTRLAGLVSSPTCTLSSARKDLTGGAFASRQRVLVATESARGRKLLLDSYIIR